MDKDIKSALDEIDDVNPFATYLSDSTLSRVGGWVVVAVVVVVVLLLLLLLSLLLLQRGASRACVCARA